MYVVKKTGYVEGRCDNQRPRPPRNRCCDPHIVTKIGYVLSLREEQELDRLKRDRTFADEHEICKNATPRSFDLSGYTHYQVVTFTDATDACTPHDGRIYRTDEAQVGVNMPPFHYGCRCIVLMHNGNPNHDPHTAERILWENIAGGRLTFLEIAVLLYKYYGDFCVCEGGCRCDTGDERENDCGCDQRRQEAAAKLASLFSYEPEILKYIEAFGQGAFAMPVHPVPGEKWNGNDFPNYAPPHENDFHGGRDILAAVGTPVYSATAGRVVEVVSRFPNDFTVFYKIKTPQI